MFDHTNRVTGTTGILCQVGATKPSCTEDLVDLVTTIQYLPNISSDAPQRSHVNSYIQRRDMCARIVPIFIEGRRQVAEGSNSRVGIAHQP